MLVLECKEGAFIEKSELQEGESVDTTEKSALQLVKLPNFKVIRLYRGKI